MSLRVYILSLGFLTLTEPKTVSDSCPAAFPEMSCGRLISVDYEVFGSVQGVFFRKFTKDTAQKYGLVGWVKNTDEGTVTGTIQGPEDKVRAMKLWLRSTGSPKSQIDRCEFSNEEELKELTFQEFLIDRPKKKSKMAKKK